MFDNVQLLTVRQFAQKHPFISAGGLRWLLYSNSAFRSACSRQLGRKVLLLEERVMDFILKDKGRAGGNEKFQEK